jgi:hypothetical protein
VKTVKTDLTWKTRVRLTHAHLFVLGVICTDGLPCKPDQLPEAVIMNDLLALRLVQLNPNCEHFKATLKGRERHEKHLARKRVRDAAPELLAAVKDLLSAVDPLSLTPKAGASTVACLRALSAVELAVAKAERRSS